MKLAKLLCVALTTLVLNSASVWEGAASASSGENLPDSGYYVATNSFPRNTVVDITNLENGRSIRVIVAAGIDVPGLLAVLSKDAAGIIGLPEGSIGRIRMNQPSDPIAFSRFTEGMATYGEPDFDLAIPITEEAAGSRQPPNPDPVTGPSFGSTFTGSDNSGGKAAANDGYASGYTLEPEWEEFSNPKVVDIPNSTARPEESGRDVPQETPPALTESASPAGIPPKTDYEKYDFSLLPAEERPPEDSFRNLISSDDIIPSLGSSGETTSPVSTSTAEVSPLRELSIPIVGTLERGKYYVQIGAFSRAELTKSAVSRIDGSYPLIIQAAGSDTAPMYRLLLGPLNLGESGAMLQRLKSIGYKDAFVRKSD
jgi:hypothetical protein